MEKRKARSRYSSSCTWISSGRKSEKVIEACRGNWELKQFFVTVDAPVPGKREADERVKADESLSTPMSGAKAKNDAKGRCVGEDYGWLY